MAQKRKRSRSKAQRAATKKLVALNRRKARPKRRRKATKRRSSPRKTTRRRSRKTNKRKASRKNVARKGKLSFIDNPTVKKAAIGLGLGTLATVVLGLVSPQLAANPLIRTGVGFLGGGPIGAIATLLIGGGGLGNIGGLLGGGGNGAGAGAA